MELIRPCRQYESSYFAAAKEYQAAGVSTYRFLDGTKYDIFERMENFRTGNALPEGYVRATYLWLVSSREFLGEVSIRHSLTPALLRYGGNIGYGVRRSMWNKGLGTTMLSMALAYAGTTLRLHRVLVSCDDDNLASARVIEKNGGILQDRIENTIAGQKVLTRRYWIETSPTTQQMF